MSVTKTQIEQIATDSKALNIYNKLVTLADEVTTYGNFGFVNPTELICKTPEEVAVLKGYRQRGVMKQKEKIQKYHDKLLNSTFFEE